MSRLEAATDRASLDVLRAWLAKDWSLHGHLIVTSELFVQQVDMIGRTDLRLCFTVEDPDKPGRYPAFE